MSAPAAAAETTRDTRYRPVERRSRLTWAILDGWVVAKRSLLATLRVPQLIVFVIVQPIMFVVLFRYVFGGAIRVPGGEYVNFLMPGIFVQTMAFGGITTGIGLAEDMQSGLIDRFRSLPMASSAVLTGRTVADLGRNLLTIAIMLVVGFAVGFRPHSSLPEFLLCMLLLMGFSFAFSWVAALVGLLSGSAEAAQSGGFIWLFPLTFASSVFVPVSSMPDWLKPFAEHNPISVVANALRGLFKVDPTLTASDTRLAVLQSIAWILAILAVFVPLSVARYRHSTAK
jgi:ABC-2 type transport system permease protein/oleandomycin transport system permease protein